MNRSKKKFKTLILFSLALLTMTNVLSHIQNENQNPEKEKMLLKAAANNDLYVVEQLIKEGVNIETMDKNQRTPLMIATYNNNIGAARILMEAGANVNALDDILNTPFLYAGASGHLEILKLCLLHHADFQIVNRYGGTALIPAAEKGHIEVVKTLVNIEDYPIDHVNYLGWTALLEAVILSDGGPTHQQIVKLLIDAGCNVNIADKNGLTPLQHARKRNFSQIAQLLEKTGAK